MFVKPNLGIEEDPRGCDAGSGTLYRVSLLMAFLQLPFFVIEEKYILIQTIEIFDERLFQLNAVLFH